MSAPSHRRVDEDILKRIRSLLLARNVNNPPRTPYPSDEKPIANFSEDGTSSPKRNFNTTMKQSTRREKRLSLPESASGLSRSPSMVIDNAQKTSSPPPELFMFPPHNLRSSSSAHDLRTSPDTPDVSNLTDGPSSTPGKKKARLKLVLQDIPKSKDTQPASCVEIGRGKIPKNDTALHEDELSCCAPCENPEEQPSKYIIRDTKWPKTIEAEPSDLACFLAGCSPGQLQCSKHPSRRAQSTSLLDARTRPQDMEAIGQKPQSDFDRLLIDAKRDRINKTTTTDGNQSSVKSDTAASVTSKDAYPHVIQSQRMASRKSITMPFSSAIFTNFSLPGPRTKWSSPTPGLARIETQIGPDETVPLIKPVELKPLALTELQRREPKSEFRSPPPVVRTKQSDGSMRSGKSGKRHALLRSSGSDGDPPETGLPAPAVLSTIKSFGIEIEVVPAEQNVEVSEDIVSPAQKGPSPYRDLGPEINDTIRDTQSSPVAGHLANLQKTIDLVDNVRERVQDVQQYIPDDDVNKKIDQAIDCPVKSPKINPVDAAYWGFVPTVKDKVENAVQSAVRNAVQEVVVPKGARKKEASEVYRLLMADSLGNAARNADEFLKRPSLWNDIDSPQKPEKTFQPDIGMETIPLNLDQIVSPENHKQGSVKNPQEKGQAAVNNSIPERFSSKNKVLASKEGALNSSQNSPTKEKGLDLQKPPNEQLIPKKNLKSLRATSSADSLRPNAPSKFVFDDRSSVTNISPERKLARRNTIYWLRDLITSNGPGPYEPQLTALPPRVKRGNDNSGTRPRSQTAPSQQGTELYVGADMGARRTEEYSADQVSEMKVPVGRTLVHDQFARTIDDLELLLERALLVAQQAADNNDPTYMPAILGDANRILKDSRNRLSESAAYYQRRQNMRSRRTGTYSDELSSIASIHESLRSYGDSTEFSDDDKLQNDPYAYRNANNGNIAAPPKNPQRKRVKDRISTPYRGRSRALSGGSDMAEAPLIQSADRDLDYIKAADPRSLPAEVDFAKPPRKYTEPPDDSSPPEALGELIRDGSPPKFYNPDPFKAPTSSGTGRRVSEKSPRRLSPAKQKMQQPVPIIITDDRGKIPVPRGDSVTQRCASGGHSEEEHDAVKTKLLAKGVPGKREVREYIESYQHPPIHNRESSKALRKQAEEASQGAEENFKLNRGNTYAWQDIDDDYNEKCTIEKTKATAKPLSTNGPSIPCSSSTGGASDSSGALDFGIGFVHAGQPGNQPRRNPRYTDTRGDRSQEQDNNRRYDPRTANDNEDYPDKGSKENRGYDSRNPNGNGGGNDRGGGGNGGYNGKSYGGGDDPSKDPNGGGYELRDDPPQDLPQTQKPRRRKHNNNEEYDLSRKNHLSLREDQHKGFSFARSHKKPAIARDWKPARKRFVATVACISTALVGILVGIYAGEVPAIQYYIVDFHHYSLLGNVFFYLGLSIPTFFFWPLPLLHGRKPYILGSMALAMPLLFPQAVAVGSIRSPYVRYWRIGLILPRALMGFCLGFANMNFKATLTDLFGASLQCENPHQEVVDENDVRRHGGGMGIWLGLWTWSAMGSIGVGFMIGAMIINHLPPAWGFYTSIFIIAGVLFLNIITPEVRRSAFRRSVAEVKNGETVSRRLARGEVKMHMVKTGPKWWGEEMHYGYMLSIRMLTQPGFMVMAVYVAWMYAQIVLIIVLLGSLTSKYYKFTSPFVGLSVMSVPLGAMVAIPFQHASLFSRSHSKGPDDDDDTRKKKMSWSSHMLRRAIFVLVLPFAGLGYTLSSTGPPVHFLVPILFAALIGFLSNLALAECHGILMETFDTSDLQPGMAGRARGSAGDKVKGKRTNYSSFPRVQSAFAITQALGYCLAAIAVGVGGSAERHLGQQSATGVMAGILLILSILLLGVLVRFKDVQIIPDSKKGELSQWKNARRTSAFMRAQGVEAEEPWRPIIIGNPTHHTRRMCILEMGSLTRWSEIRMKNRLVDANSMEAKHPNMVMVEEVEEFFGKKKMDPALLYQDQGNGQDGRVQNYRPQGNANDEDRLRFTGEDLGNRRDSRRELSSLAGNEGPRRRTGARASERDQERG
ncbi:hypothetical protein HYFRA_00003504 [Hymenoscyphus fraxineus]|uniref:Uncharacterized protein n=1 Tax=Hymenoscyphus fraxineus TaxID=746836 RepID=A0A9N9KWJ6_9HELO|nr:hypothetical protein HYFRA_00003504 [Hymenoscyphus fraxineus]